MAGNFQLLNLIGTGTFGEAWVAKSRKDDKKCVVKVINILKLSDKELEQSLTEVSVLGRMHHPNIVRYFDAYVSNGSLNIAMEYADGGDLHRKICNQKGIHFGKEVILDWFVQICLALRYIHVKNILHRDLKSQNIFLTSRSMVKVGDFGIARILRDSSDHAVTTIGTPFYLSPEICQKKPYNHKSDMWALGCVLYEMCCLHVPFDAQDFQGLILKILQEKYDTIPRHLGSTLNVLVKRLLDKNPDNRPSAEQVLSLSMLKVHVQRHEPKSLPPDRKFSSKRENDVNTKPSSKPVLSQRRVSNNKENTAVDQTDIKKTALSQRRLSDNKQENDGYQKLESDAVLKPQEGKKPLKKIRSRNSSVSSQDKENLDPSKAGKTYLVKNPKFRRLSSAATPKISRIVARQRAIHSAETTDHKPQQEQDLGPKSVLFSVRRDSEKSENPNSANNSKESCTKKLSSSLDCVKGQQPSMDSVKKQQSLSQMKEDQKTDKQPPHQSESAEVHSSKNSRNQLKSNGDNYKPPTGRKSIEPKQSLEEIRNERRMSDKFCYKNEKEPEQQNLERRWSLDQRTSKIPRRQSLERRPTPIGSENRFSYKQRAAPSSGIKLSPEKKSLAEKKAAPSGHKGSHVSDGENDEVFLPAHQMAAPSGSRGSRMSDSENEEIFLPAHEVFSFLCDEQKNCLTNEENKKNKVKEYCQEKLKFGPQLKEIHKAIRRSSSCDNVLVRKQNDSVSESPIPRALSAGNIDSKKNGHEKFLCVNRDRKPSSSSVHSQDSKDQRIEKCYSHRFGISIYIARAMYNSIIDFNKNNSAVDNLYKVMVDVLGEDKVEEIVTKVVTSLGKQEDFHVIRDNLLVKDQIYLPLVLQYIQLVDLERDSQFY